MGIELPTGLKDQLNAAMQAVQTAQAADNAPAVAVQDIQAQPTVPTQPVAPDQPPQPPEINPVAREMLESADWKAKHDRMYGQFSAKVGTLNQQLAQLQAENARLAELAQRQQSAQAAPQPQHAPAEVSEAEIRAVVSPEQIDEYGIEYWKQQFAVARAAAASVVPQQQQPDDTRIRQLEQTLGQQMEAQFFQSLNAIVPDWRQINSAPQWTQYLATQDPLTGYSYEQILNDAFRRFDVSRVSALFGRFKAAMAQSPKVPVESQVSLPARSAGGVVPTTPKRMSTAEFNRAMLETTAMGLTPVQAAAKQQELLNLHAQGLVGDDAPGPQAPASAPNWST